MMSPYSVDPAKADLMPVCPGCGQRCDRVLEGALVGGVRVVGCSTCKLINAEGSSDPWLPEKHGTMILVERARRVAAVQAAHHGYAEATS